MAALLGHLTAFVRETFLLEDFTLDGLLANVADSRTTFDMLMIVILVGIWPYLFLRSRNIRQALGVITIAVSSMITVSLMLEYLQIKDALMRQQLMITSQCGTQMMSTNMDVCRTALEFIERGIYLHLYDHMQTILSNIVHNTLGRWLTNTFLQIAALITIMVLVITYKDYKLQVRRIDHQAENMAFPTAHFYPPMFTRPPRRLMRPSSPRTAHPEPARVEEIHEGVET